MQNYWKPVLLAILMPFVFGARAAAESQDLKSGVPASFCLPAVESATMFSGELAYRMEVPEGASRLVISLVTRTPNTEMNLYARYGKPPELIGNSVTTDHSATTTGGNETITVLSDTKPPLRAGVYYIALGLMSPKRYPCGTLTATVNAGPPVLEVSQTSLRFILPESASSSSSSSQTLRVRNAGNEKLFYKLVSNQPWLTVSTAEADSSGQSDAISISVRRGSLAPGSYKGEIQISGAREHEFSVEAVKVAVRLDVAAANSPSVSAVRVTGASDAARDALAPGSIAWIAGSKLAARSEQAPQATALESLGGATVLLIDADGNERKTLLTLAAPNRLVAVIPEDAALGSGSLVVDTGEGRLGVTSVEVRPVVPALFTSNRDAFGSPAGQVLRNRADGTQAVEEAFRCGEDPESCTARPIDLTETSDGVFLMLFGSGIRGRSHPTAITATVAGEPAEVFADGTADDGAPGMDQVILRLSPMLVGSGDVRVQLWVDRERSNTVTIQLAGAAPPPTLARLTPAGGAVGQTFQNLTIEGEYLRGTTAVEVSPPEGVTISNLRTATTSVRAGVNIAGNAAPGRRELVCVTPGGRSNPLAFEVRPRGSAPQISRFTATQKVEGDVVIVEGRFDFTDPDGDLLFSGSLEGSAKLRFTSGSCTLEVTGPSLHRPGETAGTVDYRLTFSPRSVSIGIGLFVTATLVDAAGNGSNQVSLSVVRWYCGLLPGRDVLPVLEMPPADRPRRFWLVAPA